jgi:flagellar biosynthesis/type III secretory pathway M-ring protein FliF/YscJ
VFPVGLKQAPPFSLIALYALILLALLGIWMPAVLRVHHKGLERIINLAGASLVGVLFVAFWIIQWPKWQTPALLTSLVAVMLLVVLIDTIVKNRKNKAAKNLSQDPQPTLGVEATNAEPLPRIMSHNSG